MNILRMLLGVLLLLVGRRLFWLAVGILGFLFGFDLVTYRLTDWPMWAAWLAAVGIGSLCALGAVFLQRVSFGVGGFLAGGYLTLQLLLTLGMRSDPAPGVFFLLGGVVGAVLAIVAVDWVLVALTSLVGAAVVTGEIVAGSPAWGLVFLGLAAVGVAVQSGTLRWQRGRPRSAPRSEP